MPRSEKPQIGQSMLQRLVTSRKRMAGWCLLLQRSQWSAQGVDLRGSPSHRSRLACQAVASELTSDWLVPQ